MFVTALAVVVGLAAPKNALPGAAAASPRPLECGAATAEVAPELWSRVRAADRSYCRILARGHTRLHRAPADALKLAEEAEKLRPGTAAAKVLRARALVRLGRPSEAWALLSPLSKAKPGGLAGAIDDPGTLHDIARAAVASGAVAEGHALYRILVARASLLGGANEQTTVLLEAGAVALALGPDFENEAELYFDEARRALAPGYRDLVLAFTVLSLDRGGRSAHARALAEEIEDPWSLERFGVMAPALAQRLGLWFPSGELHAAIAVAATPRDVKLAEQEWRAYLADPRAAAGPWAEHARVKLAALGREPARARRKE